jgi:tetratricopeptide (TPR) repeat protein
VAKVFLRSLPLATVAEVFALALRHQQQGNLRLAEELCQNILQADASHADSYHLLGILAYQKCDYQTAVAFCRQAVALAQTASCHCNLGLAHEALGQWQEAVTNYHQALRLKPDFAAAYFNLANARRMQGDLDEAIGHYQQALRLQPAYAEAHNNLALAFDGKGMVERAISQYRQALRLKPDFAEAHNNLGSALEGQGNIPQAAIHFQEALRLRPDFAEAHSNLGNALHRQGQLAEAMAHFQTALRIRPQFAEARSNLGSSLFCRGELEEAMVQFQEALRIEPGHVEAHKGRALLWLLRGDFEHGWPELEWSAGDPKLVEQRFSQPIWDGSPLGGRAILLHAEQGFGDTIHFIRYVQLVAQCGGKVIVECQAPLVQVLAGALGMIQVVPRDGDLPPFDIQASLVKLPRIFDTRLDTIPSMIPYVRAAPLRVEKWRRELKKCGSKTTASNFAFRTRHTARCLKVGIAWQGNPSYYYDRYRSVPLAQCERLAAIDGVQLISLQKGPGVEQLAAWRGQNAPTALGDHFDEAAGAFMDTAAIMRNLDLVICSDSAVAHVAGALGVQVWVLLPLVPDWRWLLERESSPWYPTMRLFRQTRQGHWGDVFTRVTAELRILTTASVGSDHINPVTASRQG